MKREFRSFFITIILFNITGLFFTVKSQKLQIIDVNPAQFPEVEVVFKSAEINEGILYQYDKENFSILENNNEQKILKLINPYTTNAPLSLVLVIDISGSMTGERIETVQNAVKYMLDNISLASSEVSIISFNNNVYLNCDFTHDYERIIQSVNNLVPESGTNYKKAFLQERTGAIDVAKTGLNKRVIVFLTDGKSTIDNKEVIDSARMNNIRIYCITVLLEMPDELKTISSQTGGWYYEALNSAIQIQSYYSGILNDIKSDSYARLFWLSEYNCNKTRDIILAYKGYEYNIQFEVPDDKVSKWKDNYTNIYFTSNIDQSVYESAEIITENAPIQITNIKNFNSDFTLTDSVLYPLNLEPDTVYKVGINFSTDKHGVITDKLIVSAKNCPDKIFMLSGGEEEKIRIVSPKGGEIMQVNSYTNIQWTGINPKRKVRIEYTNAEKNKWEFIGITDNSSYNWKVPSDTGNSIHVRLTTITVLEGDMYLKKEINVYGNSVSSLSTNDKDSLIATCNKDGSFSVIDISKHKILNSVKGFYAIHVAFGDSNELVVFCNDEIVIWNYMLSKLVNRFSSNKRILNSLILSNEDIGLLPSQVRKRDINKFEISSIINQNKVVVKDDFPLLYASVSPDGERVISVNEELNLKVWDVYNCDSAKITAIDSLGTKDFRIVLNTNSKTACIEKNDKLKMIDLIKGDTMFEKSGLKFKKFSKSGDYFVCLSQNDSMKFINSYNGEVNLTLSDNILYHSLNNNAQIVYYSNDTIYYKDFRKPDKSKSIFNPYLESFSLNYNDTKIALVNNYNSIEIYTLPEFQKLKEINEIKEKIIFTQFSNTGDDLYVSLLNNTIQLWSPLSKDFGEVTSNKFSIINPQPKILKQINFDSIFIGNSFEKRIPGFITNSTDFPIEIKDVKLLSENFQIVQGYSGSIVEPHSADEIEINFSPRNTGKHEAKIITYTQTDSFVTNVYGVGMSSSYKLLNESFFLGEYEIGGQGDSILNLFKNTGSEAIKIEKVFLYGPDTVQFKIIDSLYKQEIEENDTFKLKTKFVSAWRGTSSCLLKVKLKKYNQPLEFYLSAVGKSPRVYYITGKTVNSENNEPISSILTCFDLVQNESIVECKTNEDGKYLIQVNADRNYGIYASHEGFISSSEQINLKLFSLNDTIYRNIYLSPLKSGSLIRMNCLFFAFNESIILDESYFELNRIVKILKENSNLSIEIHGHTDSDGNDNYNLDLSKRRAISVMNYMVKQGVPEEKLSIRYFGSKNPVASNSTEKGKAQNRRVELKIK